MTKAQVPTEIGSQGISTVAAKHEPPAGRHTLLRSSPAFLILAVAVAASDNFADPDLWMHIMVGREIVRTGHIPLQNAYSYSGPGQPWHNHVWLAQAILALSYDTLGVVGLKILKLLCLTIAMGALAAGLSRTKASLTIQRVVLLAAAAATAPYAQFRPQVFTIALLSIVMAVLAGQVYDGRARLWPLIPMFALWANLHGGFVVGLGALGITAAVVGFQEIRTDRRLWQALRVSTLTAACAGATVLNPFGPGLWTTVLHSVSDPLIRQFVVDWISLPRMIAYVWSQSPLKAAQFVVPVGLFIALPLSLVAAPETEDASLAGTALLFIAAAVYSSRNVPCAVIALSIPLAQHLSLAFEQFPAEIVRPDARWRIRDMVFPLAAALAVGACGGLLSSRLKTWEPVPSGAVAYMKRQRLHGNILSQLSWGGYLVWHGTPEDKIFVDGRWEVVYPDAVLRAYLAFRYQWPGAEAFLDRYPHDFVLVSANTRAYQSVAAHPRWKLIYKDRTAELFARASSPIARGAVSQADADATPSCFP